ncbi:hypothetical protein ACFLZK_00530 [Patescibacteria group bacterium]
MENINIGTGVKNTLLGFKKDLQNNKWPLPVGYRTFYFTSFVFDSIYLVFFFLFNAGEINTGGVFWFVVSLIALIKDKQLRKQTLKRMPESVIDKHIKYKKNEANESEIIGATKTQVIVFYVLWGSPILLVLVGIVLIAAFGTT